MKALETKNLIKNYWEFSALKNINFTINEWDFFALLWVNGAGKTTIIWIITDLVKKTAWEVKVFWVDLDTNIEEVKSMIWVVPQEFNFDIFMKVDDTVIQQAGYYGIEKKVALERTEKILKELDLWDKRSTQIRELSGWMKRRVMIARALVNEPKLLILDEPTAGVDINLRKSTWEYLQKINKAGTTILLTTHYLEEVEQLCNAIAVINKWEILENCSKDELFSKVENSRYRITLQSTISEIPKCIKAFSVSQVSPLELEIEINKKDTLNCLFEALNKNNIEVSDIKNITNELEQLFTKLTR